MRRFRYSEAVFLSFFFGDFYRDVGRRWAGLGYAYLLFLLALAWLPSMLRIHLTVGNFVRNEAPKLMAGFPRIEILNGVVTTVPPERFVIRNPESGEEFLIIDTSEDMVSTDSLTGPAIVLTRSKLIVWQPSRGEARIRDLGGIKQFSMDREDAERWLQLAGYWLGLALYLFILPFSFAYRAVQVLIYALIANLFARAAKLELDFATRMRLSAVAITPAVVVDTAKDFTPLSIPFWFLICFLISMFYLRFGVTAMAEPGPAEMQVIPSGPPGIAG